jgi:hypothetical protein
MLLFLKILKDLLLLFLMGFCYGMLNLLVKSASFFDQEQDRGRVVHKVTLRIPV